MAFKIKVAGASSATAKPKAKPAAKRSTARPTAAKPAAKRGPGRPRTTGKASPAAAAASASRRSSVPKTDDKTMKTLLAGVTKAGDRRRKAEAEHKASVDALHEAAQAALDGGVPMARVSDASGISRQWLYKMGEFAGRGENGSGSKPAAKSAVKRATSTKQSTKRTQSKSAGTRPRIKSRA
jgi:hypothetical protein